MVWKETCAVEERLRFVLAIEAGEETFAALCRRLGVSRRVGYKWYARYRLGGRFGVIGPLARAWAPSARAVGRDRGGVSGGSAGASALGSGEGSGVASASRSGGLLAGSEHDRGFVRPRGPDGEAPPAGVNSD